MRVVAESADWIPYDLPHALVPKLWKGRYRGQEQKWFLLQFTGTDADVNIQTEHPEFSAWRWLKSADLVDNIVPFKRDVYVKVVEAFKRVPVMRTLAFLLCMFAPMPALALSCRAPLRLNRPTAMRPNPRPFLQCSKARLPLMRGALPQPDMKTQKSPQRTVIPARFKGHSLSKAGFVTAFDRPVDLVVRCAVVWCGGGKSGENLVAFVEKTETGYALEVGPCGGRAFEASAKNVSRAKQCMTSGNCSR